MNLPCCCYLRFCPNRNLQRIIKIVSSNNSSLRFTASLVYHFRRTRRLEEWRFQERQDPVANQLSQLRVQGFRLQNRKISCRMDDFKNLQHLYHCHWRSCWSAFSNSSIGTNGEDPQTALGWTCSKSNTSNIKRRTSGLPYTQYASPCSACWTEVVEGFLRRRLCSNLSCTVSP